MTLNDKIEQIIESRVEYFVMEMRPNDVKHLLYGMVSQILELPELNKKNENAKPSDIDPSNTLNILELINRELRQITFIASRIDSVYNQNKFINGMLEQIKHTNDCVLATLEELEEEEEGE